jgi:hypothetical protein
MQKKHRLVGQDAPQAPQVTLSPAPAQAEEAPQKVEEVVEAPKVEEPAEEPKVEEPKVEEPAVADNVAEAEATEETTSKRSRKKQADSDEG